MTSVYVRTLCFLVFTIAKTYAVIRHGDYVSMMYVGIDNNTSVLYNNAPWLNDDNHSFDRSLHIDETLFKIYKDPYYVSQTDVILTGYTIRLMHIKNGNEVECLVDPKTKQLKCSYRRFSVSKIGLRLLDKDGRDKTELQDSHYVKFRSVGSNIDCNGSGLKTPLQCKNKSMKPKEYGFIMYKTSLRV